MVSTCQRSVLPRVEKFARQYDIKVAIHNHGPEDKNFPSPYDVLAAVKNMEAAVAHAFDGRAQFRFHAALIRQARRR